MAFFPAPVPRTLELPADTIRRLAETEGALGRLAGVGGLLPHPELLIRPYLLREALSSTRIEGTQASMVDVLEADASGERPSAEVEEVVNYVTAMRTGLTRLEALPVSVRLLREMHRTLLAGVRGDHLAPGELRRSQNWIGPPGSTLASAPYVPPPPEELGRLLANWERFANEPSEYPLLIQNALLHAQFETIHPFLDGNGRLGRLIIVFFLVAHGRLPAPLLYLSSYLEARRDQYYAALQTIRQQGDPLPWITLFLDAVRTQATDAVTRAGRILDIRENYRELAGATGSPNAPAVVELIAQTPIVTAHGVERETGVSRPTALRLLSRMADLGILEEMDTGARGQRRYVAREMLNVMSGVDDE